jgi:hypothetical protein
MALIIAQRFTPSKRGYSRGVNIVVCVCHHPKAIGVLTLPSVESLSIIASAIVTCFGVLPDVRFCDAACLLSCSISVRFPSFLSRALFVTDRFREEQHDFRPIYSAIFRLGADGMRASIAESLHAAFASSRT